MHSRLGAIAGDSCTAKGLRSRLAARARDGRPSSPASRLRSLCGPLSSAAVLSTPRLTTPSPHPTAAAASTPSRQRVPSPPRSVPSQGTPQEPSAVPLDAPRLDRRTGRPSLPLPVAGHSYPHARVACARPGSNSSPSRATTSFGAASSRGSHSLQVVPSFPTAHRPRPLGRYIHICTSRSRPNLALPSRLPFRYAPSLPSLSPPSPGRRRTPRRLATCPSPPSQAWPLPLLTRHTHTHHIPARSTHRLHHRQHRAHRPHHLHQDDRHFFSPFPPPLHPDRLPADFLSLPLDGFLVPESKRILDVCARPRARRALALPASGFLEPHCGQI